MVPEPEVLVMVRPEVEKSDAVSPVTGSLNVTVKIWTGMFMRGNSDDIVTVGRDVSIVI